MASKCSLAMVPPLASPASSLGRRTGAEPHGDERIRLGSLGRHEADRGVARGSQNQLAAVPEEAAPLRHEGDALRQAVDALERDLDLVAGFGVRGADAEQRIAD